MTAKKKKKLNKEQKSKIGIILAWYNLAWAISEKKSDNEQKRISNMASEMIEDIILDNE